MTPFETDKQTPPATLQDLSPASASLCLSIRRFLAADLGVNLTGKKLVAAFSAGADSTALLLALRYLAPSMGFSICAAHMDHALRPDSSEDAAAAERLCAGIEVNCQCRRRPVATSDAGIEEAARRLRYEFLEEIRADMGADWIVLGHHLNDLAEDVLMRLMRGAGWPALGGMSAADSDRKLLRPFLLTPKADLVAFVRELGVSWREDPSNSDRAFLRNRIRLDVLPLFLRENPNFLRSVASLWRIARLDEEHASSAVDCLIEIEDEGTLLHRHLLEALPPSGRLRACKAVLDGLGPGQVLADSLFALERVFAAGGGGKRVQFPGDKVATVKREGIFFCVDATRFRMDK